MTVLQKRYPYEIVDADSKMVLLSSNASWGYTLADGYIFFIKEGPAIRAYSWTSSQPSMLKGDLLQDSEPIVLGRSSTTLIVRLPNGELAQLEGHPPRLRQLGMKAPTAKAVAMHADGLILASTVNFKTEYVMGTRRLTDEIQDVAGPIARDQRLPIFPTPAPSILGNWIIFCADAGILAYRPRDRKLVLLQQLSRDDDFWLYGTPAIPNAWAIGFAARRGPYEGIYLLRLGRMLEP
jgi:hypothetical protein